jgi:cytochrome c peroxidase
VDPGARADRRANRRAHARRHRRRLALKPQRARAAHRAALLLTVLALPAAADEYTWHLPRGFPRPAVPADNPMSEAKVALGRRLFFEPRLSVTGRYSCASCHDPTRAFTDGRARARGATGEPLAHNTLTLVNVAYNISFGWQHPGVHSLEAQMRQPLFNTHPVELGLVGGTHALRVQLQEDPRYAHAFAQAFPAAPAPSLDHLIKAIAAFERTLIFGGSAFDRYVFAGEHAALSDAAKRGMALFFSARAGCAACHSGINFSGNWRDAQGATGRASFAVNGTSAQALRVPTLRNLALTAPYMHDGRYATLEAVLEHYSRLARQRPSVDRRLPQVRLTQPERADLIAFLNSLTDEAFTAPAAACARCEAR